MNRRNAEPHREEQAVKIRYRDVNLRGPSLAIVDQANAIIADYRAQGYELTLRQLYYQFVSRDLLANKQTEYKRLGGIVDDARYAGLIDWEAIVDRGRSLRALPHADSPAEAIHDAAFRYYRNLWDAQTHRPEVWVEKEALIDVVNRGATSLDVPFIACKGYMSASEMWAAGQRMVRHYERGQTPVVIHLGDHDPSGLDMTRDITERLCLFVGHHTGYEVEVRRVALTIAQVRLYDPPPNPAKLTDSRAERYVQLYGDESWELDALEPGVITTLIEETIREYLDEDEYDRAKATQDRERATMRRLARDWPEVESRYRVNAAV
jgi:hypothetical protein